MASSYSEQPSDYCSSSGVETTSSFMSSLCSDSSGVQTEITPPSSPTPNSCERTPMTPRDIPEASHRLAQLSQSSSHPNISPTKSNRQRNHHRSYLQTSTFINEEAGYEADGDEVSHHGTGGIVFTKPVHRPKFPRIDTRLRRRVASLLANPPSSGGTNETSPTSHASVPQTVLSLKKALVRESHELQQRTRESGPIGLGLGFPDAHPFRNRSFTMPSISPTYEQGPTTLEWLPSLMSSPALADPYVPVALQPMLPEITPSPIDYLPPSVLCYGEPVELTPSHLAALAYTPEYATSYTPVAGVMARQPLDEVMTPKHVSSTSMAYA